MVFVASDDRPQITGQVLAKQEQGVVGIVTFAVGAEASTVVVLRKDAESLEPGDRESSSAKSFNPEVKKMNAGRPM